MALSLSSQCFWFAYPIPPQKQSRMHSNPISIPLRGPYSAEWASAAAQYISNLIGAIISIVTNFLSPDLNNTVTSRGRLQRQKLPPSLCYDGNRSGQCISWSAFGMADSRNGSLVGPLNDVQDPSQIADLRIPSPVNDLDSREIDQIQRPQDPHARETACTRK